MGLLPLCYIFYGTSMWDEVIKDLLTKDEVSVLRNALDSIKAANADKSKVKLVRKIVPIEEWIVSPYYAGPDCVNIYPYWRKALCEIFDPKARVNEVILSGAIGVGKSTCAVYGIVRLIYELSCYSSIQARFKLMLASLVSFLYFSLSKTQAELTGFGQIKNLIDSIPYFREHFPRNEGINSLIIWPESNLLLTYGSTTSHAIGMNMIGSILDEANFNMNDPNNPQRSTNVATERMARMYSSILNRARSRFIVDGVDYSLSFLVSSSTIASSLTEQRIAASSGNPHVRVYAPSLWEVKPKGTYSDKHFWVFCGDESVDPYIVNSIADIDLLRELKGLVRSSQDTVDAAINELPVGFRTLFVSVPEDFRTNFEVNIIGSLQELAGVSVSPTGKLFTSKTAFNKCIKPELRHPFTKDQPMISTGDSIQVSDYLIPDFKFTDLMKKRYIHIDQSVQTDYTGFSMVHIDRYVDDNGIKKPVIRVDFMLDIIPPAPPRQISIGKVRDFCFFLRNKMGVPIKLVTYDMFASLESRQVLNEGGINAEYLSVDRTDEQYLALVNLIMEGRIEFYDYAPLRKELFDLIWYRARRKVDHPGSTATGGTKDLCDSLAGAVWNALHESGAETESVHDIDLVVRANNRESTDLDEFFDDEFKMVKKGVGYGVI